MTNSDIYIVGASGFGREVEHLIRAINNTEATWRVAGFIDDAPSDENRELVRQLGHEVIGDLDVLLSFQPSHYVIGIGTGTVRRHIDARLTAAGWTAATLIHPDTSLGYDVTFGPGSIVCAGVRATTNISCGRHVHLNLNATVGHDSSVQDYVTVNPLVAISGGVSLGESSTLGAGSTVLQYLSVGRESTVGAGAVVVRDVGDGVTVKGIPAK